MTVEPESPRNLRTALFKMMLSVSSLLVVATSLALVAAGPDARATAETSDVTLVLRGGVSDVEVHGRVVTTVEIPHLTKVGVPVVWVPSTKRVRRFAAGSDGDGCDYADPVVHSGPVVAFECGYQSGRNLTSLSIFMSSRGAKKATLVSLGDDVSRDSYNLIGNEGLIAFNRGLAAEVWVVQQPPGRATMCPGTHARKCRRITSGISLIGVADGSLLGWAREGGLAFLSPRGRIVRRLSIARAGAVAGHAQVARDGLFVERRGVVFGYSLADGRVLGSWRLFAARARGDLVGVANGFAAYVMQERLYVVRLRDRSRRVVPLPSGGFIVAAKLAEEGLAYAYGREIDPVEFELDPHDRLVWKPTGQIRQLFDR